MNGLFGRLLRNEEGQDLIEYALLATFVSLAATAAITTVGTAVNSFYQGVATALGS